MTVQEFTGRMWYTQPIVVIPLNKLCNETDINKIKERAIYVGTPHELRSVNNEAVNNRYVDGYGVIDNTMIITVHMMDILKWKRNNMKAILDKVDDGIAARELADMLMDDTIPTYGMFNDLVKAYINGNEDFRKGMDKTLETLLWKNMEEICEYMKENACYGEEE